MDDPAQSSFLRLIGPPGAGKSQIARAIAYRLWTEPRPRGRATAAAPVLRLRGDAAAARPRTSSSSATSSPGRRRRRQVRARRLRVRAGDARGMGGDDRRGQHRPRRRAALINATLDGRLALYLPATGETVIAQPGFAVLLAYNPGLVGATDIPDAWHSRFPATLEVTSNWAGAGRARRAEPLVTRGVRAGPPADRRRGRPDAGRRSSATSKRCGG